MKKSKSTTSDKGKGERKSDDDKRARAGSDQRSPARHTVDHPVPLRRKSGNDDQHFRRIHYGPANTNQENVKVNMTVLTPKSKPLIDNPSSRVKVIKRNPVRSSSVERVSATTPPVRSSSVKRVSATTPPVRSSSTTPPVRSSSVKRVSATTPPVRSSSVKRVSATTPPVPPPAPPPPPPGVTIIRKTTTPKPKRQIYVRDQDTSDIHRTTGVIQHDDNKYGTGTVGPYDTNTEKVKVNITVLGKRIVPPPPQTPPPEPVLEILREPPPSPPVTKRTYKSQAVLNYVDHLSGLSEKDLKFDRFDGPEFDEEQIDVVKLLSKFGIPDHSKALDSLLDSDSVHFDFGGLMRQYYSYVLRSYCLINMQDRYRGAGPSADCLTSIDLSRIGTRDVEMDKITKNKLRKLEEKREKLREVAVDEDHFEYLKSLSYNQPTLLPLTIVHLMNEQMVPIVEDIFRSYGRNFGTEKTSTKDAGFHYMKIRKRCEMYKNICGGSCINEDLTSFYK